MQFNQPNQDSAGAFRMYEGVPATGIAERVPDQRAAGSGNLRTGVVEVLHLKANVMQAGPACLQELAQVRLRPEWADNLETNAAIAFEIVRGDVLIVNFLEPRRLDAK